MAFSAIMTAMVRTQVQFSEPQIEALRRMAQQTGRSIADLTREAVELYLEQQRGTSRQLLIERAIAVAGQFSSGLPDVGTEHDRYLAEALEQ
jgi:hypothetical protein